jgi:hypothetical protein
MFRRVGSAAGVLVLGTFLAFLPVTVASAHKATAHKATKKHATGSSGGVVSENCPTSAEISALAGSAYPAPKKSSASGTVSCNYSDPTTSADLVLVFSPAIGTSASEMKTVADSQAHALSAKATSVSGFDNAAYIFTLNDASTNASGVATTELLILDGSKLVDLAAQATPAQVEAIAHYVLTH